MSLEKSVIARYKRFGEKFEILIDPKGAEEFKEGKVDKNGLRNFLEVETIFKDADKGDKASEDSIKKAFETDDVVSIASEILKHGEIQLTAEQRKEFLERKTQTIISTIARNAIDPRTSKPHPPDRIKNALEEAKFRIDANKPVADQIQDAVRLIRPILPIKFENVTIAVKIPADYAGKAYSVIRNYTLKKEEWQGDGSYVALVEIPGGVQDTFYGKLNSLTHGTVETRLLKDEK